MKLLQPSFALVLAFGLPACSESDGTAPRDLEPKELVQSGCNSNDDCPGGRCIAGVGEGLCTADCTAQDQCPEGTVCADVEGVDGICLLTCTPAESAECTEHLGGAYSCDEETNYNSGEDVWVCIDGR